ncbi:MAG TPA: D-alanyl-D-alanine carboxypeptidase/D-alanyl-D-alanine-endopeptidase [Terriglobales bacterium]|nr:D-alanyl-D-alanine carboxypeptidase/D-alanyl-D-alanine-endopeptidase [Terriglobales bacterium]
MNAFDSLTMVQKRTRYVSTTLLIAVISIAIPVSAQQPRPVQHSRQPSNPPPAGSERPDVARFRVRVEAALNEAHARKVDWGLLVVDRDTGETLFELNSEHFFTPASNVKLFTSAFALATLGPDYRFRTSLESKSVLESDGKLAGDLILVGRGDPDLSNRKFPFTGKVEHEGPAEKILAEMADAAVARGLKEVDGDIVADDQSIPYDPYPAGWSVGDLFFNFGASVTAITLNDNIVAIEISPGAHVGDPAIVSVNPAAAADGFTRQITTSALESRSDSPSNLAVVRQPGPNFLLLRGSIPLNHAPMKLELAMTDPAETSARALKQLLESRGVRITGSVRVLEAPPPEALKPGAAPVLLAPEPASVHQSDSAAGSEPDLKAGDARAGNFVLAEHISPPLLESVRVTNKVSQNLHAELFLRTVAREKTGIGSTEIGLKLEQEFLKSAGVAEGDAVLTDGSGLSANNLATPRAVVALLQYIKHQPWGADFLATLPVAGVDGTLEDRMKNTPATGLIQAKTGGLEHVHALSGYATTSSGEYLVFSIFANNNPQRGRDSTAAIDAIAVAMVETLGDPASKLATKKK